MSEVKLTSEARIADYFAAHKAELKGAKGDAGKTAYQTAVENGFEGTEADWLSSLKGSDADATAAEEAIAAEVLRAKAAESALSTGLSTEESRAKGKEAELAARIAALKSFDVRVVDVLPNTGVANTVYLVPSTKSAVKNVKDEYLWINGAWEQIGSTAVDMSGYSTTSQMNSAIASAVGGVTVQSIGAAQADHTHDYIPLVSDRNGNKTAVTIGTRGEGEVGVSSVAEGNGCVAVGALSHAEGSGTNAIGQFSHAEGAGTTTRGISSHAEGAGTTAIGALSHSEGYTTTSRGYCSHSEGVKSESKDNYSFAFNGDSSRDTNYESHGEGTFNINPKPQGNGETDPASGFFVGDTSLKAMLAEKQAALSSDQLSVVNSGPYLPTSSSGGGSIGYDTDPSSTGDSVCVNKLYSLGEVYSGEGFVTITDDENGPLSSISQYGGQFKNARQEVEEALPYSSTSTPADRTCATVTVASTGASVTVPKPSTANKVTAFCVYLDMTELEGAAPTVGFKYPDNTDADILTRGGEGLSYETGAVNAVFFIQCGTKYIASAQVYK